MQNTKNIPFYFVGDNSREHLAPILDARKQSHDDFAADTGAKECYSFTHFKGIL